MHEAKTEIRTEFTTMLNRKVISLKARKEAIVNEVLQDTTSTLEALKEIVAAVCESQENMWWAIDGMSKNYKS